MKVELKISNCIDCPFLETLENGLMATCQATYYTKPRNDNYWQLGEVIIYEIPHMMSKCPLITEEEFVE